MTYTLIDYFKTFHALRRTLKLSLSAQAVYFTLLGEFNAARFPKLLSISERALQELSGLSSHSTVNDAKRILKNCGLIDFKKTGRITQYELILITDQLPTNCRPVTDQLPTSYRPIADQSNEVPNIRARVDKDIRHKTIDLLTTTTTTREENFSEKANNSTEVGNPLETFDDLDEVQDLWQSLQFAKLNHLILSKLKVLIEKHGKEAVIKAMNTANESNGNSRGVSFNYFAAILERQQNPKKGGKKVESIDSAREELSYEERFKEYL